MKLCIQWTVIVTVSILIGMATVVFFSHFDSKASLSDFRMPTHNFIIFTGLASIIPWCFMIAITYYLIEKPWLVSSAVYRALKEQGLGESVIKIKGSPGFPKPLPKKGNSNKQVEPNSST